MEYKPIHLENSKSCVICRYVVMKTKWLTVALATKRRKSLSTMKELNAQCIEKGYSFDCNKFVI